MTKPLSRIELAIVPSIMARITPPGRRMIKERSEDGETETLKFIFFDGRTSLLATRNAVTGTASALAREEASEYYGSGSPSQTREDELLLNKTSWNDFRKTVSAASLVKNALMTAAGTAADAAKKTLPPGQPESAKRKAAQTAFRAAKKAAAGFLGTEQEKEAVKALKEFLGKDVCRLAENIWGINATVQHVNGLRRAGVRNVEQAMKEHPQLTRLALASSNHWEEATTPEELHRLGRIELELTAGMLDPDKRTEDDDPVSMLERIDRSVFTKFRYTRKRLALALLIARGTKFPLPQFAVIAWLDQNLYAGHRYDRPDQVEPTFSRKHEENRYKAKIHAVRHACRLYAEQPEIYTPYIMRRTLLELPRRIEVNAANPALNISIHQVPDPARIAMGTQAHADRLIELNNSVPKTRRSPRRENPDLETEETGARIAALWSVPERREQAAAAAPEVRETKSGAALKAGRDGPELYSINKRGNGAIEFRPGPLPGITVSRDGTFRYGQSPLLPALNAAALTAALSLDSELPGNPDRPETITAAAAVAALADGATIERLFIADFNAALSVTRAANRLLDPETAERAARVTGRAESEEAWIAIEEYNASALAGESLDRLAVTNPGAAAWIVRGCPSRVKTAIRHPGQLVSKARKDAAWETPGTRRSVWKVLTATKPEVLERLRRNKKGEAKTRYDRQATRMCAVAAAHAGAKSITEDMAGILEALTEEDDILPDQDGTLLAYCFREPEAALETDLIELRDYCRAWNPTATTLSGLRKAAVRWHHLLRQEMNGAGAGKRPYLNWETAIKETGLSGNIKATALTDTLMLAREGERMKHCVVTYDTYCAKGRSRVFHLSSGATVQLTRHSAGWKASQVRREMNARPSEEDEAAAKELAERYTEAWREEKAKAARKAKITSG